MFFEASRLVKITYNTYSCAMSGVSRETMKMDGRDRVECQNWEKRDINVIFRKVFKSLNAKKGIVSSLTSLKRPKKRDFEPEKNCSNHFFERFSLERELLSKNTGDSTVGSLRDKKENISTWRGLRMGTRFVSF